MWDGVTWTLRKWWIWRANSCRDVDTSTFLSSLLFFILSFFLFFFFCVWGDGFENYERSLCAVWLGTRLVWGGKEREGIEGLEKRTDLFAVREEVATEIQ